MYNNINQDTAKTHLVHFIFGNCQLSTEETEEKKRFQETEQLNTEFLNTLKRNCHLPSVPSAFNEKKLYFCICIHKKSAKPY